MKSKRKFSPVWKTHCRWILDYFVYKKICILFKRKCLVFEIYRATYKNTFHYDIRHSCQLCCAPCERAYVCVCMCVCVNVCDKQGGYKNLTIRTKWKIERIHFDAYNKTKAFSSNNKFVEFWNFSLNYEIKISNCFFFFFC